MRRCADQGLDLDVENEVGVDKPPKKLGYAIDLSRCKLDAQTIKDDEIADKSERATAEIVLDLSRWKVDMESSFAALDEAFEDTSAALPTDDPRHHIPMTELVSSKERRSNAFARISKLWMSLQKWEEASSVATGGFLQDDGAEQAIGDGSLSLGFFGGTVIHTSNAKYVPEFKIAVPVAKTTVATRRRNNEQGNVYLKHNTFEKLTAKDQIYCPAWASNILIIALEL